MKQVKTILEFDDGSSNANSPKASFMETNIPLTIEQEKLCTDNLRFVHYLAKKLDKKVFVRKYYDDLISEGYLALVKAARTYKSDGDTKFLTYAGICIRNQFYMFLRKRKRVINDVSASTQIIVEDDTNISLADVVFIDDHTMSDAVDEQCAKLEVDKFLRLQNQTIQKVVHAFEKFKTRRQVAQAVGLSQSYVSHVMRDTKTAFTAYREKVIANG